MGSTTAAGGSSSIGRLFLAAENGQVDVIERLLMAGIHPEIKDSNGLTPLHYAASNGRASSVAALLAGGAKADTADNFKWTALHMAAMKGHTEAVTALLRGGANAAAADCCGETALHKLIAYGRGSGSSPDALLACCRELLAAGASPEVQDALGRQPQSLAATLGLQQQLELALEEVRRRKEAAEEERRSREAAAEVERAACRAKQEEMASVEKAVGQGVERRPTEVVKKAWGLFGSRRVQSKAWVENISGCDVLVRVQQYQAPKPEGRSSRRLGPAGYVGAASDTACILGFEVEELPPEGPVHSAVLRAGSKEGLAIDLEPGAAGACVTAVLEGDEGQVFCRERRVPRGWVLRVGTTAFPEALLAEASSWPEDLRHHVGLA